MPNFNILIIIASTLIFGSKPVIGLCQHVNNVPDAFNSLNSEPEIITIVNELNVPSEGGHFQGVQLVEKNGKENLLISGSSKDKAYILQADLASKKTDKLFTLLKEPFRHAGGFQVSEPFLAVGIEDNILKTYSKVYLYNFKNTQLSKPILTIDRKGEAKLQTAGSVGLIALKEKYLMVVSNWDSRNWDFYTIGFKINKSEKVDSFAATEEWPSYQSINLIKDKEAIYAIGFYKSLKGCAADLILVSKLESFAPIIRKEQTKFFNCKNGVDFNGAAGLQVDKEGKLNIWGTQKSTGSAIVVNKFSEKCDF
jgi:hypothetical protein